MIDDPHEMMSEQLVLIEALFTVVHESNEAEVVRVALAALVATQAGLSYLSTHPIVI